MGMVWELLRVPKEVGDTWGHLEGGLGTFRGGLGTLEGAKETGDTWGQFGDV